MGESLIMMIGFGALLLAVGVYYLYDKSKKSTNGKSINKNNINKAPSTSASNSIQDSELKGIKKPEKPVEQYDMSGFIKFDKIANDMIYQNKGERYTMVIQCKGINYNLMSEIEQMAVEEGFIMFLNTLKFPIQLYVQTRSVDLNNNVKAYKERVKQFVDKQNEITAKYNEIEDDVDATQEEIEHMKREKIKYTNIAEYVSDMTRYVEKMALNKYMLQRNFYIVFSYNKSELATTEKFTKEEYEDIIYRQLYTRAQGIVGALNACSVTSKILNSNELAQLVYVSFNKDDANTINIKDALESGMFRLYTSSEDVLKKKRAMIDEELDRQSKLRVEEAVRQAIDKGFIVTEAESNESVEKEIDRRALKIIDKSKVDENIKNELKNTIKENRKARLKAIEEQKAELQEEQKRLQEEEEKEKLENDTENTDEVMAIVEKTKEGDKTDEEK